MLSETFDVLQAHSMLSKQRQGQAIHDYLFNHADIVKYDDIDVRAVIADEARVGIWGETLPDGVTPYDDDTTYELNEIFMELTRPMGLVTELIAANGHPNHLLCTTRVKRKLALATGGHVVVEKTARFVSDQASLTSLYREQAHVVRLQRGMERFHDLIMHDLAAQPALAQYHARQIAQLYNTIQDQLPAPKPNNGGGNP